MNFGPQEALAMASLLLVLSVFAVGGAITMAPEMHRFFVEQRQWMTHEQFNDAIALAQAAPGPNILFVTLLGFQAAALLGALISTVAIMLPSSVVALLFMRWKQRQKQGVLITVLRTGLVPLAIGLTAAAGWVVGAGHSLGWAAWLLSAATMVIVIRWRINPVILIGAGAMLGIVYRIALDIA
jgi:chromate transporter